MYKYLIVFFISLNLSSYSQVGIEPDGSGTVDDPYLISNLENLRWLSFDYRNWTSDFFYKQINDIDAKDSYNAESSFTQISHYEYHPFNAHYDGQNYCIFNLKINTVGTPSGFFGFIGSNGVVQNLNLVNILISGGGICAGFVGEMFSGGQISNCSVSGDISNWSNQTGGFVGRNYGNITNCFSNTIIDADDDIGGFCSHNYLSGSITNCYSVCESQGYRYAGGFVSDNRGEISNCYARGTVFSEYHSNGFGYANYGTITNSYSAVIVTGDNQKWGFLNYNGGTVNNAFYDKELAGTTAGQGGVGLTTSEMKNENTFVDATWDLVNTWSIQEIINDGYPHLIPNIGFLNYNIWLGTINSDWSNLNNWSLNFIPSRIDNVLIPVTSNNPIISFGSSSDCNNLIVYNNAIVTLSNKASLISDGIISNNGTIKIEKEVSKTQWHYISSPITTETSNIFLGEYLQRWDETIGDWVEITSTSELLEAGKGYALFVQNAKENQQYTFIGTPNTGDVVKSISYHDNFTDPINGHDGANLLGNPYPSSIDWNTTSGLGAVYCWDGNNGYVAYPETGDYGTGSRYIAPMQGFFIVVPDNDPSSFTFTNSMRTHEGATNYYKNNKGELSNGIVLGTGDTNSNDLLIVRQNIDAQVSFEHDKDALKFFSNTEGKSELWSEADNEKLSIDIRADISEIPLGFKNSINGSYSIYLDEIADISSVNIYDHKTDVNHDLLSSPFNFDWDKSDSYNRFTLFINATGIEEASDNDFNVYYYNGCIFIIGDQMDKFEWIGIYDINGKLISYHSDIDTGRVPINSDLSHGLYLVKFMSSDVNITKKIIL